MNRLVIFNGRLVLPDGAVAEDKVLICSSGKIEGIIDEKDYVSEPYDEVIDAGRNYVTPGFIDLHVHGGGGHDFMDGTIEAFLGAARACEAWNDLDDSDNSYMSGRRTFPFVRSVQRGEPSE